MHRILPNLKPTMTTILHLPSIKTTDSLTFLIALHVAKEPFRYKRGAASTLMLYYRNHEFFESCAVARLLSGANSSQSDMWVEWSLLAGRDLQQDKLLHLESNVNAIKVL